MITEQSGGALGDVELEDYVSGEEPTITPYKRYRGMSLVGEVNTLEEAKPKNHGNPWTKALEIELIEYVDRGYPS